MKFQAGDGSFIEAGVFVGNQELPEYQITTNGNVAQCFIGVKPADELQVRGFISDMTYKCVYDLHIDGVIRNTVQTRRKAEQLHEFNFRSMLYKEGLSLIEGVVSVQPGVPCTSHVYDAS